MARRVLFSFHFENDNWRASQVRQIGAIEGNRPVTDNEWEAVKRGGDTAIQKWIDGQLDGKSCTVVLVGSATAGRKWIKHEIKKTWDDGKGLVGIRIHNLKDRNGRTSSAGGNPFAGFTLKNGTRKLTEYVTLYDPPGATSNAVYESIQKNIESLVDAAIKTRTEYI
jgi:hypothetical protein